MTTRHFDGRSSLLASLLKRLAIASILVPPLALAAGCVEVENEEDNLVEDGAGSLVEDGAGDLVEDGAGDLVEDDAGDLQEAAPSPVSILVYDPSRSGTVRSAMEAAGARFVTDNYEAVIIHVDGSNSASLARVVTQFLKEGKQVVLDSKGGVADRSAVAELSAAVAGIAAQEAAVSIVQDAPDAFTVLPIVDSAPGSSEYDSGNTPSAVLGRGTLGAPKVELGPEMAELASDNFTKYSFQGKGKPAPPIVPSYVDNKSTYIQSGTSGSNLTRYLYVGNPQPCPKVGVNFCNMTWGQSYAKAVANGTTVSVNLTNKLTEKLTGGVTLGYSLTVTNTHTITWSNGVNINPGWTARPVSYVLRKSGFGDVKNAYIFVKRVKNPSACKPSGGCYGVYDTYERQPNTKVGTWAAKVLLNQGAPSNGWKTFKGDVDPNVYTYD